MRVNILPRPALAGLVPALFLLAAAPLRAQLASQTTPADVLNGDLEMRIPRVTGALSYEFQDGTAVLPLDRAVTIVVEIVNLGPDSARSVVVSGGTDPGVFELDSVIATGSGPCQFDASGGFFTCLAPVLPPADTVTVGFVGRPVALPTDTTLFSASTGHPNDPDFSNNDALLKYVVRDAPPLDRITGTVYLDLDGDGAQGDPEDEPGLEGQTVFMDVNGNRAYDAEIDTSDVTIFDGTYMLEFPPVGEPVTVGSALAAGWEWTAPADGFWTVDLGADGQAENVDFGARPRNSAILGAVWDDVDGDGQVDPDEPRLEERRVYADLNDNGAFDEGEPSDLSDGSGLYIIPDLAAGTYTVRLVPQPGFVQTAPEDEYVVTLGEREFARGRNFASRPESALLGSIHGQVLDIDDQPFPLGLGWDSVAVILSNAEGVVDTAITMSMDLDEDGEISPLSEQGLYWFERLPEGSYTVRLAATPRGTRITGSEELEVDLESGEVALGINFLLTRLGAIEGTKFLEVYSRLDRRNVRIPFIALNPLQFVIEDASTGEVIHRDSLRGRYGWGVPAGEYIVRETSFGGGPLSRANFQALFPQEEEGHRIIVEAGEVVEADFVNAFLRSITGFKFEDLNGDGEFDPSDGDRRLPGWTIRAAGPDGVRETVTDEDGKYQFEDLLPGLYLVAEDASSMPGFRQTYPPTPEHLVLPSEKMPTLAFGNQRVTTVWVDDPGVADSVRTAIEFCNTRPVDAPPCHIRIGGDAGGDNGGDGGGKRVADTLRLARPLPPLSRPTVLDGGGVLVLDGSAAGPDAAGIVVTAGATDIVGVTVTGFSGHAIVLDGEGRNRIRDNVLTGNGGAGIRVVSGSDNLFLGNVITDNGGLSIDLGDDGPTVNDPDDSDGLQNYPTLAAALSDSGLVLEGELVSAPDTTFILEFFAQTDCLSSGEAQIPLGATVVFTDGLGRSVFTEPIDTTFAEPHFITATATHPRGRTSELSPCTFLTRTTAAEPAARTRPAAFRLEANYPNPFNPSTTIRFELAERARVRLDVYDALGRRVAMLVDETRPPGAYAVVFDAGRLPSGVYFYRLAAGDVVRTRSMVLLE